MVKKFGKTITASFIVIGVGLITFLSTPIWLRFGVDTDIPGFLIIVIGLVLLIAGLIRRKKLDRVILIILIIICSILTITVLTFIVALIFPDFEFR
jgi:hypothetical protein